MDTDDGEVLRPPAASPLRDDHPDDGPEPTAGPPPVVAPSRWPFGILVVAALRLVDAAGLIIVGLDAGLLPFRGFPVLGNPDVTRALEVTFAILTVIGVIGLLARQGWGWVLTMALVGLGLLGEVIRYSLGVPDPAGLLILVVSAFYLNQRQVRAVARDMLEDDR